MVNALVDIAVRCMIADRLYDALAAGPIPPELHAALDHELSLQNDPQQVTRVLKTEQAYSVSAIMDFRTNPPQAAEVNSILSRMFGWTIQRHFLGVLDYYAAQLPLAARPWYEVHDRVGREGAPAADSLGAMTDLLIPAIQAYCEAEARSTAVMRALRINNALRAFAEKDGHEARGLEDLSLPKEATIDPYSGAPLKLKHTDDGWIVYSVMRNGVDDGGSFIELKDFGVGPRKYRSTKTPQDESAEDRKLRTEPGK